MYSSRQVDSVVNTSGCTYLSLPTCRMGCHCAPVLPSCAAGGVSHSAPEYPGPGCTPAPSEGETSRIPVHNCQSMASYCMGECLETCPSIRIFKKVPWDWFWQILICRRALCITYTHALQWWHHKFLVGGRTSRVPPLNETLGANRGKHLQGATITQARYMCMYTYTHIHVLTHCLEFSCQASQLASNLAHEVRSCSLVLTERGSSPTEVNHIRDRQTHTDS